ncbi:SGNH/GDSL hydrolase family protein [Microbacterium allomyrinae]|uniref:SGNH/GDSL hydrolase family protein n=1 Tax=Microbacterium allomyrinae TaxID=2830666 RepID=A0A9X1LRE2_9MICO|nr:SGNH/GDSL hydrolase family protein [Microbacterium allomyrinae]MCC2030604.1 SGNH/GDSL hydrolase family protein [Microbacterium allomyrinae]
MRALAVAVILVIVLAACTTPSTAAPPTTVAEPQSRLDAALDQGSPITLYALGSSVGVGAATPDPERQSPPARLAQHLEALGAGAVTLHNLSVNGSVAWGGVSIWRDAIEPANPTALLLTYGMNDGAPASFNSGETLPGAIDSMRTIVTEAQALGVTVFLATTPSPNTELTDFSLPPGNPVIYPEIGGAPLPADPVTNVGGAPFSARHAIFNEETRALGAALHATILDVEPSWTFWVANFGEASVYDGGEYVHPNLLGHEVSYGAAIRALTRPINTKGAPPR